VIAGSTSIITVSVVEAQPPNPAVMVHTRVEDPLMLSPVTPEVGLLIEVTIADPKNTDHVPVSLIRGVLAAKVAVVILQRSWSGPATAIVVVESTLIITSLIEGAHPPLAEVIIHLRVEEFPILSPVTPDAGSFTDDAAPVPENVDHAPVSVGLGVLAASVAVVMLHRS
jgi:hypothetical protein